MKGFLLALIVVVPLNLWSLKMAKEVETDLDEYGMMGLEDGLPNPKYYPPISFTTISRTNGYGRPRALIFGKVAYKKIEDDGDHHYRLEDGQGNFVILEVIPELPLKSLPEVGQTIYAWGVVRYDGQHGGWGELHPLVGWKIKR